MRMKHFTFVGLVNQCLQNASQYIFVHKKCEVILQFRVLLFRYRSMIICVVFRHQEIDARSRSDAATGSAENHGGKPEEGAGRPGETPEAQIWRQGIITVISVFRFCTS